MSSDKSPQPAIFTAAAIPSKAFGSRGGDGSRGNDGSRGGDGDGDGDGGSRSQLAAFAAATMPSGAFVGS